MSTKHTRSVEVVKACDVYRQGGKLYTNINITLFKINCLKQKLNYIFITAIYDLPMLNYAIIH